MNQSNPECKDDNTEEDWDVAKCIDCGDTHVLDKMEVKDDEFYCRSCFKEDEEIIICIECGIPGEEFFEDENVCQHCKYETIQEIDERVKKYYYILSIKS
jgi:hypothetical protein